MQINVFHKFGEFFVLISWKVLSKPFNFLFEDFQHFYVGTLGVPQVSAILLIFLHSFPVCPLDCIVSIDLSSSLDSSARSNLLLSRSSRFIYFSYCTFQLLNFYLVLFYICNICLFIHEKFSHLSSLDIDFFRSLNIFLRVDLKSLSRKTNIRLPHGQFLLVAFFPVYGYPSPPPTFPLLYVENWIQ